MKKKQVKQARQNYKKLYELEKEHNEYLSSRIDNLTNDKLKSNLHVNEVMADYLETKAEKDTVFSTGAVRKVIKENGHMVCPEFDRRVGLIYSEGLVSYKDKNINYAEVTTARFGLPLDNLLKHLHNHYLRYRAGDLSEDNLAKVGWAIQQIMHQEAAGCQHYNLLIKPEDRTAKPNTLYVG